MLNIKELLEMSKNEKGDFNVDKLIEKSVFEKNNTNGDILNNTKLEIQIEYLGKRQMLHKLAIDYKEAMQIKDKDIINLSLQGITSVIEAIDMVVKVILMKQEDRFINVLYQKEIDEVQKIAQNRVNILTEKYGIKVTKLDCYVYALKFNDTQNFIKEEMKDLYDIDNTHIFWDFEEKYAEIYYNERVDWIDLKQLKMKLSIARTYEEKNDLLCRNVDFMIAHEYGHLIIDKYDLLNNKELQHIYYSVHRRGFREYVRDNMEEFLADCIAYQVINKEDRLKVADTFINKINEIVCK